MRRLLFLVVLLSGAVGVRAQGTQGTAYRMRTLATEPTSCTQAQVYFNTTTNTARVCGPTNTWNDMDGPAGTDSPGGGVNTIQYNNGGIFGGVSGATSNGTNLTLGSGNLRATLPQFT